MGCPTATVKYLVFIFNTLCALLGIGTIVVASLAMKNLESDGKNACITLIVVGVIVFVVSFFGCFGAIRENSCFTWTYAVFLIILIIGNCVVLFGMIHHIDGETTADSIMEKAWADEIAGRHSMEKYEKTLQCCGVEGPNDYQAKNMTLPVSCYADGDESKPANLFKDGCSDKLAILLENSEQFVKIFVWTSLAVEIVALICACILAIHFRNAERRTQY